ncbi:O-antigen ligase [Bradyrhizobium sp. USDA 4448]
MQGAELADGHDRGFAEAVRTALAKLQVLDCLRCAVVVATLLCVLVTLEPFKDLTVIDDAAGKLAATYLCFAVLAVMGVLLSVPRNVAAFRTLWTPLHLCFLAWMALNILLSENPAISLQRFALTASVMSLAVMMPLLPPSLRSFNLCFAVAAIGLLLLCYLGVMLAPGVAVHNAADAAEPGLAGDWRGTFEHKNVASPVMAILVYFGAYLISAGAFLSGPAILGLAAVFLFFTGGKTASMLCLVVWAVASVVGATKGFWQKCAICFVPLLLMNLLTVGSVAIPQLTPLTNALPIDTTFTGRTEVWEFALGAVAARPFAGHGYAAFWDGVKDKKTEQGSEWVATAAHSHNSYLDLAVTIGLPGLILVVLIFVCAPLKNFHVVQSRGTGQSLARFCLVVWLFGLYYGTTETFLLDRQNPMWFMFVVAVVGLHFLARFGVRS